MKKILVKLLYSFPSLLLFVQFFRPKIGAVRGNLQSVHDKFRFRENEKTIALDLGCGPSPQNRFGASKCIGVDLFENEEHNILKVQLGFEKLPFDDNSVDYITAYDLLEHIPRYADLPEYGNTPFIFLMNECYRVLKPGGLFLSMTPVYPYMAAFQDPTHNNIMTIDTFEHYFSKDKLHTASVYGITTDFEILYRKMLGQHLVAVLKK